MWDQTESQSGRTTSQLDDDDDDYYDDDCGGGGGGGGGGDQNTLTGLLTCFGGKVPSSGNNNKST